MFDIGFQELVIIGVVALLVVGPERLPAMARTVGLWVGKIRGYVSQVKGDIEREIRADELRQIMDKPPEMEDLYELAEETRGTLDEATQAIETAEHEIQNAGAVAATEESNSDAPEPFPGTTHDDSVAQDSGEEPAPGDENSGDERHTGHG